MNVESAVDEQTDYRREGTNHERPAFLIKQTSAQRTTSPRFASVTCARKCNCVIRNISRWHCFHFWPYFCTYAPCNFCLR